MKTKRVSDSATEQVYVVRSEHLNGYGRLFGGRLLEWIDDLAGIVARRHSRMWVTTASIDNLSFKSGAYINDVVVLKGKLTYVGKTSMEVKIETYTEDIFGSRVNINCAYVVVVAIDENECPIRVPAIGFESEEEKEEWAAGERRANLRRQRRRDGY